MDKHYHEKVRLKFNVSSASKLLDTLCHDNAKITVLLLKCNGHHTKQNKKNGASILSSTKGNEKIKYTVVLPKGLVTFSCFREWLSKYNGFKNIKNVKADFKEFRPLAGRENGGQGERNEDKNKKRWKRETAGQQGSLCLTTTRHHHDSTESQVTLTEQALCATYCSEGQM